MSREKMFSVTKDDFEWEYFRAGGKGGQKQNKTNSGVRIRHASSGAVEESREGSDQLTNRRLAFKKMCSNDMFKAWLKVAATHVKGQPTPEQAVEKLMADENLRVEVKDERGKWTIK